MGGLESWPALLTCELFCYVDGVKLTRDSFMISLSHPAAQCNARISEFETQEAAQALTPCSPSDVKNVLFQREATRWRSG